MKKKTEAEAFWSKVEKTDGCWNWKGQSNGKSNRGIFEYREKRQFAHRVALRLLGLPTPRFATRLCRNARCVRPEHLGDGRSISGRWAEFFFAGAARGPEECWPRPGAVNEYRRVVVNGRTVPAHRFAWELVNGPIPPGLWVLHRCDNPPCCNPAHLFLGTNADNVADCVAKGRNTRKLNWGDVDAIRSARAAGVSREDLAATFGVTTTNVRHIETWRTWTRPREVRP